MTKRKPTGVSFESFVERQIREAQDRGEFADLPGEGKPLPGAGEPHDELWWVKKKVREEEGTVLPPSLALRKEAETARAAAREARSAAEARRIIEDVNAKILQAIRMPMSGPPLNLMPFDVEAVVRDWEDQSRSSR